MADLTINDPVAGKLTMPWSDNSRLPTSQEIDDFIKTKQPQKIQNPVQPTPKADTVWGKINSPIAPEVTVPNTMKAGPTKPEDLAPYPVRALSEMASGAYDNIVRPATSALGIGVTGLTTAAGIPEVKAAMPAIKPAAQVALGGMAIKGATEIPQAVRDYRETPNIDTGQRLALSIASPLAMGAGAVKLGSLGTKAQAPVETTPEIPKVVPPEQVTVPKNVKIQMKPGFEDVLEANEDTKTVTIKDAQRFKEGLAKIDGPDKQVTKLATDLKASIPSTDYNEGYNPDAQVKGTVNQPRDISAAFKDWVNGRAAARWTGQNAAKSFESLDNLYKVRDNAETDGIQLEENEIDQKHPLVQLQQALSDGKEPELERYFNQLHESAREAGSSDRQLQLGYKENYLPQMWKDSPETVNEVFQNTKRLGTKPTFSMKSVIQDYKTGIENGLTPAFDKPSDLIASYAKYVDKFVADKNFFDQLRVNGQLKLSGQLNDKTGWEALDPKRTPLVKFAMEDAKGEGVTNVTKEYYVPKEIAKAVNSYLQKDAAEEPSLLSKINSGTRSLVMTSGVPGTGVNVHGFNILGRMYQAGGVQLAGKYLKYALSPASAQSFTESNIHEAPRFVQAGLKFSPEFSPRENSPDAGLLEKAGTLKHNWLERPLFGQIIPAMQLEMAQNFESGLIKRGVSAKEATPLAAKAANTFVSQINTDELMKDSGARNLTSAISFAPQWLESQGLMAKGAVQGLLNPSDPKNYMYKQAVGQVLKAYLVTATINKMTNGSMDPFEIHFGKDSSKKNVSMPELGGSDDYLKLIPQIAIAVAQGKPFDKITDFAKGRLSPLANFTVDLLAKQKAQGGSLFENDYTHKPYPVVMPNSKGQSQVKNTVELGAKTMLPRVIGDTAFPSGKDGKIDPVQVGTDLAGFPMRFRVKAP